MTVLVVIVFHGVLYSVCVCVCVCMHVHEGGGNNGETQKVRKGGCTCHSNVNLTMHVQCIIIFYYSGINRCC